MKWYAFNDSESSNTVNVILDHNTTYHVAWNSSGNNADGMKEVKEALENDTSTWNSSLMPRLIEANEIAKITGNTEFDASNLVKDDWFYFDTNTSSENPDAGLGTSQYKWLFDYTSGCTNYGCSIKDNSTDEYWTSSPDVTYSNFAWGVRNFGQLGSYHADSSFFGLCPVVTISKSLLS